MTRRIVLFLLVSSLWPMGCGQNANPGAAVPGTPGVRVVLLENKSQAAVSATEAPFVSVAGNSPQRLNFPADTPINITRTPNGWLVGGLSLRGSGELVIDPAVVGSVRIAGLPYRGRFRFVPTADGRFSVVNDVDIEGYVKGVLPKELFKSWHEEAYKAQAIVARTYALYEARTGASSRTFDLYPDQRSQVYGGLSAETSKSRAAVDSTRGIVVAYGPPGQEKIFKAYFSSCCGGITQSASDAFGVAPTPPLSDQKIGPRCSESPKFNWGPITITKPELTRRVRLWGAAHVQPAANIGDIKRVDIQFSNRWGRPTRFVLSDSRGLAYSLTGEEFRNAFNTSASDGATVPSSFFKPVNQGDTVVLTEGHGFGHGVGMCQWCAEHEAVEGTAAAQIVVSAYPQSKLVRAY